MKHYSVSFVTNSTQTPCVLNWVLSSTLFNILANSCIFLYDTCYQLSLLINLLHNNFNWNIWSVISEFAMKGVYSSYDLFTSQYFFKIKFRYIYNELGIYFLVLYFKWCSCPYGHKHSLLSIIYFFPSFINFPSDFRWSIWFNYNIHFRYSLINQNNDGSVILVLIYYSKELFISYLHIHTPPWIYLHSNLFLPK